MLTTQFLQTFDGVRIQRQNQADLRHLPQQLRPFIIGQFAMFRFKTLLELVEISKHGMGLLRHAEACADATRHADAILALRADVHRPLQFTENIIVEFLQLTFRTEHGKIRAGQHGHLLAMAYTTIRQDAKMRRAMAEMVADLRQHAKLRVRHRAGHDAACQQRMNLLHQIVARQFRVEFHGMADLVLRRQAGDPEVHGIKFILIQIFADEFVVGVRIIHHDAQADEIARLHERIQILAHFSQILRAVEIRPIQPPNQAEALFEHHLLRRRRHQAARLEHGNDAAFLATFHNHFQIRMQQRFVAFE